jgi:hypothetical protein
MKLIAIFLLVLAVGCTCEPDSVQDAGLSDAEQSDTLQADACPCVEPWRCEWPESGFVVGAGDCIFCNQSDAGKYLCMNLPLDPP